VTVPARDELSQLLKSLREKAGLGQVEAGTRSGTSQGSVSRWENGQVPRLGDLQALLRVYGAGDDDSRRAEQLVTDLRGDSNPSARVTMRRAGDMQKRIGRIEQGSALIRTFQVVLVPGLLQIPDYARAVFSSGGDLAPDQIEAALAGRLDRPAVLDNLQRQYVAVISEGVLRWPLGGPDVMARQLRHVAEQSHRENVHIGVIPASRPVDVAPTHGFDVFDERAAVVGIETATAFLTDPHDVAAYVKLFGDLEAAAVFGDEARAELEAARRWYA